MSEPASNREQAAWLLFSFSLVACLFFAYKLRTIQPIEKIVEKRVEVPIEKIVTVEKQIEVEKIVRIPVEVIKKDDSEITKLQSELKETNEGYAVLYGLWESERDRTKKQKLMIETLKDSCSKLSDLFHQELKNHQKTKDQEVVYSSKIREIEDQVSLIRREQELSNSRAVDAAEESAEILRNWNDRIETKERLKAEEAERRKWLNQPKTQPRYSPYTQ